MSLDNYEGVAKALENAIHFHPRSAHYHLGLGRLLLDQGAVGQAVSELEISKQLSTPGTVIWSSAEQLLEKVHASQ